jgi:hypothetical protein
MMRLLRQLRLPRRAARGALVLLPATGLAACDPSSVDGSVEPVGFSRALSAWTPGPGECSKEVHDRFSVVGPDGKLYPTWHPPVDPATGCAFGHEHGRDPRGSALFKDFGPLAFGYANEQLDIHSPHGMRHEDHVGHKIEWENGIQLSFGGGAGQVLEVTCDVLVKLHQGSHSRDAFTNNLHELNYAIRCSDRTEMRVTLLTAIGKAGEMVASCQRERRIAAGTPTPANSPDGGGKRAIPDRACVEQHILVAPGGRSNYDAALRESWEVNFGIRRADGRTVASADPYFQVMFPSRFFDATKPNAVGRPIEVCYERLGDRQARGGLCAQSTSNGAIADLAYDDPRSLFNGVLRFVDINGNRVSNADGPEVLYTDPFGRNGRSEPFPGSIRQFVARVDNSGRVGHGPIIGKNRDYGGPGVRAPN